MSSEGDANSKAVTRLELGQPVRFLDGPLGSVEDVVIDPGLQRVTHLVVRANELSGSRLVPIDLATKVGSEAEVTLRCTVAEARELPAATEIACSPLTQPAEQPGWDMAIHDVVSMPSNEAGAFVEYVPDPDPQVVIVYDRVPKGEVEIRHESRVTTSDGHAAGHVDGVSIDDGCITQLTIRRGHLWRRSKITIPVTAVARVSHDEVFLRIPKSRLKAFRAA